MRFTLIIKWIFIWLLMGPAFAADDHQKVKIADPYIELHTGPGSGYPVFYVEERGAWIEILLRKTDWFKVRTDNSKEGWVSRSQLELTLSPSGEQKKFKDVSFADLTKHRWEVGVLGGDFEGANVFTLYGGYAFTPNLAGELSVSQVLGDYSDSWVLSADLVGYPFPKWRLSPFFALGGGVIKTEPHATLVESEDRTDGLAHVGVGARLYLTKRFIFRAEYKNYVIFSSKDDNEEINEWKAGFAVFF